MFEDQYKPGIFPIAPAPRTYSSPCRVNNAPSTLKCRSSRVFRRGRWNTLSDNDSSAFARAIRVVDGARKGCPSNTSTSRAGRLHRQESVCPSIYAEGEGAGGTVGDMGWSQGEDGQRFVERAESLRKVSIPRALDSADSAAKDRYGEMATAFHDELYVTISHGRSLMGRVRILPCFVT